MTGRNRKRKLSAHTKLLLPLMLVLVLSLVFGFAHSLDLYRYPGGFFSLEALLLFGLNVSYIPIFWKEKFKRIQGISCALIVLSFIFIVLPALIIAPQETSYLRAQDDALDKATMSYVNGTSTPIINGTMFKEFRYSANQTSSPLSCGFWANYFLASWGPSSAILGLFYAVISVSVTYIGSRCDCLDKEDTRTLIEYSSMLSIMISVMIFAANSRAILDSLKYVFAVIPLLLAVILLAIGMLAGPMNNWKGMLTSKSIMCFTISFVVGALFGSLVMPFTKTANSTLVTTKFNEESILFPETYYSAPLGLYLFMCSSMITIALLVFIASKRRST